ncbi:MAG: DNA mismatch repair protein MutT, partial [Treponema sp.]|nr:DNA mismatch repair protein MutT [Treponema sp.]
MNQEELLLNLEDNEWPLTTIDHDRLIARAIVVDDDGNFYFIRANRDDDFGKSTIIETSGGGVEA